MYTISYNVLNNNSTEKKHIEKNFLGWGRAKFHLYKLVREVEKGLYKIENLTINNKEVYFRNKL